jgi:CHAT domain-containing protein/tetratricopeptide (TPR) repeat protein
MNAKLKHLLYRADQLVSAGRKKEAIEIWKEAGSLNPNDYHAWLNLMFSAEGPESLEACKHILRTTPNNETFHLYREFAERSLLDAGLTVPREYDLPNAGDLSFRERVSFEVIVGGERTLVVAENDAGIPIEDLKQTIANFVGARTWIDALLILEQHPELRSNLADVLLQWQARCQDDEGVRQIYLTNLELLRRCAREGDTVAIANVMRIRPAEVAELVRATKELQPTLMMLVESNNDTDKRRLLEANPELYRDPACELLLAFTKKNQSGQDAHELLERHLWLLFRCRRFGVDYAFAGSRQDPEVSQLLSELGAARKKRDIDAVGGIIDRLSSVAHPQDGRFKGAVGLARLLRYELTETQEDLMTARDLLREAATYPDDELRFVFRAQLAIALQYHFEATLCAADLDEALSTLQNLQIEVPRGSNEHGSLSNNFASLLLRRFEVSGRTDDVETAVANYRKALETALHGSEAWAIRSSNLGFALLRRYDALGGADDLDASIRAQRDAIASRSDNSHLANAYTILGSALVKRFRLLGDAGDLEEAIRCHRSALTLTRTSGERALVHGNLSWALQAKYLAEPSPALLDESIAEVEQALNFGGRNQILEGTWLENLGRALLLRGRRVDLDRAISIFTGAAGYREVGSSSWGDNQGNLGQAYLLRAAISNEPTDLESAVNAFSAALSALTPEIAPESVLELAPRYARLLGRFEAWATAAEVVMLVVQSAENLYQSQLSGAGRGAWLDRAKGLHALAAFALAKVGRLEEAVLALEGGRARQLGDALEVDRAKLAGLLDAGHTDLFERYQRAAEQSLRIASIERTSGTCQGLDEISRTARRELDDVTAEIRAIRGFESFLTQPTMQRLSNALGQSCLAYIGATDFGGLVLLLGAGVEAVQVIWAPGLTSKDVAGRVSGWKKASDAWRADPSAEQARSTWLAMLDEVTRWLWDEAVLGDIVTAATARNAASLVLVPTGVLGLLPLHAAWTEDSGTPTGRRYVLDAVATQYVPSGRTFEVAQNLAAEAAGETRRALIVQEPAPVGAAPLPGAELEANTLAGLIPGATIFQGSRATRDEVLGSLYDHSVHHFCCHAFADLVEPLAGGLLMSGDVVLTLRDVLSARLHRCRIVVLSACETGVIGGKLPDEALSLAAGFLQAGAAGIVSSLWVVHDLASALLMVRFYELWIHERAEPLSAFCRAQIWLRDTTNTEKVEWCKGWLAEFGGRAGPLSEAADRAYKFFRRRPPQQREFASPHYWGAFSYTGK